MDKQITITPSIVDTFLREVGEAIFTDSMDDVDQIVSFIQKHYGVKEYLGAYNDLLFDVHGEAFRLYDNYGDEDHDDLYRTTEEEAIPIALGIAFQYGGDIYCVDFSLEEAREGIAHYQVFKTNEPIGDHIGKRCFYHNRHEKEASRIVSMRGYDEKHGVKEKKSENWVSGPRTTYKLTRIQ
jgi:hypothetical protein